jgi:arylsulfatase A-like enzyme
VAIALGLAAGLLEAAARNVQWLRHQFTWVSPDVVWVAPLANALVLAILTAAIWIAARFIPALCSLRVAVATCIFTVAASALLSYEPLHPLASVFLAAGLAAQGSWLLTRRVSVAPLARRMLPWLALICVMGLVGIRLGAAGYERLKLRALPRPPPSAPDVLFVVLDTVRAANLSVGGYSRPTSPHLQRLARRGVYFQRAVATSSWTLPSHGSLFTGRYPFELSADWRRPLDDTYPTLAEIFAAKGYVTTAFVANLLYASEETGLARGFARYDDYLVSPGNIIRTSLVVRQIGGAFGLAAGRMELTGRQWADQINERLLEWLPPSRAANPGRRPFFVFVNYMDAHSPYLPPPPFAAQFGAVGDRPDIERRQFWTGREITYEKNAYDGALAALDHHVGNLFDELDRRGALDNTIVVITSDHGELFGEHGLYDHGNGLHWPTLHVPLLVIFPPTVPAGVRVADAVTLRDVPATILELAGLRPDGWPGSSLVRFWKSAGAGRANSPLLSEISRGINLNPWLPASKGDMKSLVHWPMHYILNGDGSEELFDLDADPGETNNLAAPGNDAMVRPLRDALAEALSDARDGNDSR